MNSTASRTVDRPSSRGHGPHPDRRPPPIVDGRACARGHVEIRQRHSELHRRGRRDRAAYPPQTKRGSRVSAGTPLTRLPVQPNIPPAPPPENCQEHGVVRIVVVGGRQLLLASRLIGSREVGMLSMWVGSSVRPCLDEDGRDLPSTLLGVRLRANLRRVCALALRHALGGCSSTTRVRPAGIREHDSWVPRGIAMVVADVFAYFCSSRPTPTSGGGVAMVPRPAAHQTVRRRRTH